MKVIVFALSLQTLGAPDRWFSVDKLQHFFMGTFVQSASFGVLRAAKVEESHALIGASAASVAATFGKELRDRNGRGTVSVKDGVWTLAGAAAISPVLARTK